MSGCLNFTALTSSISSSELRVVVVAADSVVGALELSTETKWELGMNTRQRGEGKRRAI